ncbi:hypothetical protein BH18ACI5_BH18ACI5_11700 [soil metagenome]
MAKVVTLRAGSAEHRVEIDGDIVKVDGEEVAIPSRAVAVADGDARWVFLDGEVFQFEVQHRGGQRASTHQGSLSAPMPAIVVRVMVPDGQAVKRGDTLIVLEAMKMELPVRAPADGTVKSIACREGQLVQPGIPLVELES